MRNGWMLAVSSIPGGTAGQLVSNFRPNMHSTHMDADQIDRCPDYKFPWPAPSIACLYNRPFYWVFLYKGEPFLLRVPVYFRTIGKLHSFSFSCYQFSHSSPDTGFRTLHLYPTLKQSSSLIIYHIALITEACTFEGTRIVCHTRKIKLGIH